MPGVLDDDPDPPSGVLDDDGVELDDDGVELDDEVLSSSPPSSSPPPPPGPLFLNRRKALGWAGDADDPVWAIRDCAPERGGRDRENRRTLHDLPVVPACPGAWAVGCRTGGP